MKPYLFLLICLLGLALLQFIHQSLNLDIYSRINCTAEICGYEYQKIIFLLLSSGFTLLTLVLQFMTDHKIILVNLVLSLIAIFSIFLYFFFVFAYSGYQNIQPIDDRTDVARTNRQLYFTTAMGEFGIQICLSLLTYQLYQWKKSEVADSS